jgi:hypothetical protein
MTIDRKDTIRFVLLLCSAVPFFFFLQTSWVRTALLGYLLTACLFGLLLVPDYPPVRTSWFWKALIPIITIHSAIILGLVWLDLRVPEINRMPRMLYGFAAMIVVIEWRLSLRIIETLQPPPSD